MPISFHLFFIMQLIVISYFDFKYRKIKNYWPLLNIAICIVLYLFFKDWGYQFEWSIFYFPLLSFLIGFIFFYMGLMGAGDSKYLVSIFLILPQSEHFDFFQALILATILYTLALLVRRIVQNLREMNKTDNISLRKKLLANVFGQKDAYAPAILLAWVLWERGIVQQIF